MEGLRDALAHLFYTTIVEKQKLIKHSVTIFRRKVFIVKPARTACDFKRKCRKFVMYAALYIAVPMVLASPAFAQSDPSQYDYNRSALVNWREAMNSYREEQAARRKAIAELYRSGQPSHLGNAGQYGNAAPSR